MRNFSRVLEVDPVSFEIKWQYGPEEAGFIIPHTAPNFHSPMVSSAQRLPGGNTLITEGNSGRVFEITPDHELIWEYISPYWGKLMNINMVYRAYRVPYEWVPQLDLPEEVPIERVDVTAYRLPGAAAPGPKRVANIEGIIPYRVSSALCVQADVEEDN